METTVLLEIETLQRLEDRFVLFFTSSALSSYIKSWFLITVVTWQK